MAKAKNTEETAVKELTPEQLAARERVRTTPRQSVVRLVQHYITVRDTAPEEVERLFGSQVEELEAAAQSGKVENPIEAAIAKVTADRRDASIKALENEDPLNGYANYVFDQEVFDEKTREKKVRGPKKSKAEQAVDLFTEVSDEDMEQIAALFAARGISLPTA